MRNETQIFGSRGLFPAKYSETFRTVEDGELGPGAVITHETGLEGITDGLGAMTDYETVGISVTSGLG